MFRLLLPVILILTSGLTAVGRELPWLGVILEPASEEKKSGTELPEGVGFVVEKIIKLGPLAQSTGKIGDVWWKLDGQILINKSQIVVLLRSRHPGEDVTIDFFRNGKLESLQLTLGTRPSRTHRKSSDGKAKTIFHSNSEASRTLASSKKIARLSAGGEDFSLRKEGSKWLFEVEKEGQSLFKELVTFPDLDREIPSRWVRPFGLLHTTLLPLDKQNSSSPNRRIRYVPKAKRSAE